MEGKREEAGRGSVCLERANISSEESAHFSTVFFSSVLTVKTKKSFLHGFEHTSHGVDILNFAE